MKFSLTHALLVAILVFTVSSTGAAQRERPLLGPQLGVANNNFDVYIGAQFAYPVAPRFDVYPSFDYYFPNNSYGGFGGVSLTVWALNFEGRYWPKLNMTNSGLYVGGGLDYTHASASSGGVTASSSDVGLGLLGGWDFKAVSWRPFGQLRFVFGDADRIEFGGGVNFKL